MEAKVIEITLAALLALVANFNDGLQQMEAKQHDKATAAFTKVIEANPNVDDIRELSLVYRAQAFLGTEEKDKALADLSTLILTSSNQSLREQALATFTVAGGDLKTLRPKESPEKVMGKFMAALEKGDEKEARSYLSGGLLQLIDALDAVFMRGRRDRSYLTEIGREFRNFNAAGETINDTNQTARLTAGVPGATLTFGLEQKGGAWTFSSLLGFAPAQREHAMHRGSVSSLDLNKLRQLDSAIEQYTLANSKAPAQLADAAAYVKDFADTRISSIDGKPFVFAIPTDGGQPWVFTATATGGQRQGVINGSVRTIPEEEFKTLAQTHGVRLRKDWKQVEVSDADAGEIRALIAQLGAGTFQERKVAYAKLKAMGETAGKLLDEATRDPDPEISIQVRKLLDEL